MIQNKKSAINVSKPKFGLSVVTPSKKPAMAPIDIKPNINLNDPFLKMIFGMFTIAVVAALQFAAWQGGHDGMVFAFTSTVIGLTAGSILGFQWGIKHASN